QRPDALHWQGPGQADRGPEPVRRLPASRRQKAAGRRQSNRTVPTAYCLLLSAFCLLVVLALSVTLAGPAAALPVLGTARDVAGWQRRGALSAICVLCRSAGWRVRSTTLPSERRTKPARERARRSPSPWGPGRWRRPKGRQGERATGSSGSSRLPRTIRPARL